ncbi:polyketide synthase [Truncatella angustata]|uniref:Polyketide synthase n=1 Tax=Truncatella angustata TaxID=152316 RepID=A0A9P8UY62_9PEZI|nr:polyketide synthase [Truncatella angustata]KAH6660300.1 polyketide synthase [Truncatella angustata]
MTRDHEMTTGDDTINGHNESCPSDDAKGPGPGAPIAIVGMSCKFGGEATSPSKLWDLCMAGKDAWTPIPKERFDAASLYDKRKGKLGRHFVEGGHFLKDISLFDSAFFKYTTDVANAMDPQIRMLLESVYESVEDAGIPIKKLAGTNTSVFAGSFSTDYSEMTLRDPETMQPSYKTGNGIAMLSNRISHFYDFHGASMTIDVGCSTSLVALHQACQSLRSGESDVSIVGSSLVCLSPDMFIAMSIAGVLGPSGKCFAWDERAEGYGRGEGVASLVLKPLDNALRDGDRIHAVVRETGLNQDGKTPTITSPSMEAQINLIQDVYRRAGLDPKDTGYVEAHMTGTPTGDPIEAEALARTFGCGRDLENPVLVGSVKPNIGHTEPVSGLAAIIKTIFVLQQGVIPPNVNYEKASQKIPLAEWRLKVPTALTSWPADKPRRASINNFGYGGTNTHVILEAPPVPEYSDDDNIFNTSDTQQKDSYSRIYIVSAKDSSSAQQMNKNLAKYIQKSLTQEPPLSPIDLAFTLAERKSRFPWATALRANDLAGLADRLDESDRKALRAMNKPRLGFVFNGQGAQWYAMGRELIERYPVFRRSLAVADKILKGYGATWSLRDELQRSEEATRVHEICLSQPLSVALQLCLIDLLASWNIIPSAVTSHSSGEIAAAYAVGALTFRQALGVVYFRGELAQIHHERSAVVGGMLAAGLSAEAAAEYVKDTTKGIVVVACHNSPNSVTLSGDMLAIDEVAARLTQNGIFARKLNVPLAYHSHHMVAMAQDYTDRLQGIIQPSTSWNGVLFASPVTGDIVTSSHTLSGEHFVQNLVSPVLFSQAFERMCFSPTMSDGTPRPAGQEMNVDAVVEIGAHGTLSGPIRQILGDRRIPYVSCLKRYSHAVETMQDAACTLLALGYPVSLADVNCHQHGKYVPGLPTYSWNHSTPHWIESRLYREYRHKRFRPHELLGSPVPGTNRQTPTWRNFLRSMDIDWLADHRLGTDIVLPGAGYVAMAIEAVRLLSDTSEETIAGYRLREIDILNTLTIPETTTGVETQLILRPCNDKELDHKGWYEFEVWSVSSSDDTWIKHCSGNITAEMTSDIRENVTRFASSIPSVDSFFTADAPIREVETASIFAGLRSMNLFHGPVFRNLIQCQATPTQSVAVFAISPAAAGSEPTYVLHPTTLDSLIQAAYVSIPDGTQQRAMVVPRSIQNLYVPRDLNRQAGKKLTAFVDLIQADRRGALVTATAINDTCDGAFHAQLRLEGLYCQALPLEIENSVDNQASALCSQTSWEVSIEPGIPAAFKKALQNQLNEPDLNFEKKLDRVSFNFISDAVKQIADLSIDVKVWPTYLQRFYKWMHTVVALGQAGELGQGSRVWSKTNAGLKQRLADDVAAESDAGKLIVLMGEQLLAILRGDIDAQTLLQADGLLDRFHESLPRLQQRSYSQLRQIIAQYATNKPGASVLEINGASGAITAEVLKGFAARNEEGSSGTLIGQYDFTDISPAKFETVQTKCVPWEALVDCKILDISTDPATQNFAMNSYDLMLSNNLALATPDLSQTLRHMRQLLKPGGKLMLVEATRPRLDTYMVFGGLAQWWEGKDDIDLITPIERWDHALRKHGFSGVDFEVKDCENAEFQANSVIMTTAVEETAISPAYPSAMSIVYANGIPPAKAWLDELEAALTAQTSAIVTVERLDEVQPQSHVVYIFTPEMLVPFLHEIDSTGFDQLKALLVIGQGLLWLSCSDTMKAQQPIYSQSTGLLRTAKQEDATKRYISLDFDTVEEGPWSSATIPHVVHVVRQSFNEHIDATDLEWEYAVQSNVLHVARVYPSPSQDHASSEIPIDPKPTVQPLWQQGRPLVWETVQTVGTLSNLYFTDDLSGNNTMLRAGMVEIQTQAMGLNFRDVMVALGQIDESRYMHDAAGIVTRLGPATQVSGLKVGDRVCGVLDGRFATHPRALWTSLTKIPDDMSWEEAASLPIIFLTSFICLFDLGRLQRGERVLIHAGSGGVGQSAIMLAQHAGAEVFVTCSSEIKRDLIMTQYGLDADHILSSRDSTFATAILERTRGAGVDIVINSLSGPLLKATWECMARFGRFFEIGKVDIEASRRLDMNPLKQCVQICGFDLIQHCAFNGTAVQRAWTSIMSLWADRNIRAVSPVITYPVAEMETAMRRMQRGAHIGKLVLLPNSDTQVKVLTRTATIASLDDPNSTYLIAGGLGGIGHALAKWMMNRGARQIVIVSRRAESHPQAASLIDLGQVLGCKIVVCNCDIAQEDQLVQLIADCANNMPPIRGVIQAAMALHDTILERLTYEQWQNSIKPKVAGSLHLHRHLPDLRFFVMLSSIAGVVGHASQANYAAGNTFQDALARHRTAQGMPAVAIDLGAVGDVGVVAESGESMRERVERNLGSKVIPIGRVLRLIEAAVCEPLRSSQDASQIITGIADYEQIPSGTAIKRDRRFSTLRLGNAVGATATSAMATRTRNPDEVLKQLLSTAAPASIEAVTLVTGALTQKLATFFNMAAAEIDTSASLSTLGVDSLVAVELRNWLSSVVQAKVTIFEILQTATMKDFAGLVTKRSALIV